MKRTIIRTNHFTLIVNTSECDLDEARFDLYLHEPFRQTVLDLGETKELGIHMFPQSTRGEYRFNGQALIDELKALIAGGA